jgi:hypothetical protein
VLVPLVIMLVPAKVISVQPDDEVYGSDETTVAAWASPEVAPATASAAKAESTPVNPNELSVPVIPIPFVLPDEAG